MFTGLVEDVGVLVSSRPRGGGLEVAIRTKIPLKDVALGDSIAVNGACLTVDRLQSDTFTAVMGRETVAHTSLGTLRPGQSVHLERAARLGQHLGGHLVQGHVDGVGRVVRTEDADESWILWIEAPSGLSRYIASKGSICVDGVSLTVNAIEGDRFRVNIVPHTVRSTCLGNLRAGESVNLEVDVIAKYVERLMGGSNPPGLSLQTLLDNGFGS